MEEPVERQATARAAGRLYRSPTSPLRSRFQACREVRPEQHSPAGLVDDLVHLAEWNRRGMALDVRLRHVGPLKETGGERAVLPRGEGHIRLPMLGPGPGRTSDSSTGCRGEGLSGCGLARRARMLHTFPAGHRRLWRSRATPRSDAPGAQAMICSRRDAGSTGRTCRPNRRQRQPNRSQPRRTSPSDGQVGSCATVLGEIRRSSPIRRSAHSGGEQRIGHALWRWRLLRPSPCCRFWRTNSTNASCASP